MKNDPVIRRYDTADGQRVYKLPVEAFPNHFTNCYLLTGEPVILIDAGSGFASSNESLETAFSELKNSFDESIALSDVQILVLTHGHIDHFGGVNYVVEKSGARIGIHELDASILSQFQERLILSSKNLHIYLERAGVPNHRVQELVSMNKWSKDYFEATPVDFTFAEGTVPGTSLTSIHTPGHCPGQVCLRLNDIVFTADHVLSHTTPIQSPEFIARYTGLGHYTESLAKLAELDGIRIGLGGHEFAMDDLKGRISETLQFHEARMQKVLSLCDEPKTIRDLSKGMFKNQQHYHVLLALLETGAHVEHLHERGFLRVVNIQDVEDEYNPPLLYQRIDRQDI
ncbi:MAG: hypothetical protein AMXMBFR84_12000 [Candidatus Hydrogenedentota bacterium]